MPVNEGYCRLCWCQARMQASAEHSRPSSKQGHAVAPFVPQVVHHQLFLARLHRQPGPRAGGGRQRPSPAPASRPRGRPRTPPPPAAGRPRNRWRQEPLFEAMPWRDYRRFPPVPGPEPGAAPWLDWARHLAHQRAEAHGWSRNIRTSVDRGLKILLTGHHDGDLLPDSLIRPALRAHNISVEHVAAVLTEMGLFTDDRTPAFETWLDRQLDGLPVGITHTAAAWARHLHDGGPRSLPRSPRTVWAHLGSIRPVLQTWAETHDHLREVTREDILTALGTLHGSHRTRVHVALRSLFRWARKHGHLFRDPTARIRVGAATAGVLQPLAPEEITTAVAQADTPACRLVVALAAVHAARPGAIRALSLDDIDLGNRRLTVGGHTRPLDDLTHRLLLAWLQHRHDRWPDSPNPHLLVNRKTAVTTVPVSDTWIKQPFRGRPGTAERLRRDRQLEEALTHGPDPLHLAVVFGISEKTAMRYADSARTLLQQAAEQPSR
ncbi:hypothetical protein ABT187_47670 [Streptomyces sp. NPDC001817]|uniref:site-specific integrase n=1 Tax=Streptomyces sp. NPDC001817 TaxID=3154398 RepID=UPI00331F99FC